MKTAEEYVKEGLLNINCLTPDQTYNTVLKIVETAQRDALEVAAEYAEVTHRQIPFELGGGLKFIVDKDSILNLMPK